MLWAGLGLVLFFIYQAWVQDYAPPPLPAMSAPTTGVAASEASGASAGDDDFDLPQVAAPGAPAAAPDEPETREPEAGGGQRIHVQTDVLDIYIDTVGGALVYAAMERYPVEKARPDDPVVLLSLIHI